MEGLVATMRFLTSRSQHEHRKATIRVYWLSFLNCSVPVGSAHTWLHSVCCCCCCPSSQPGECVHQDGILTTKIKNARNDAADNSHQPTDTSSGPLLRRNACHRSRQFPLVSSTSFSAQLSFAPFDSIKSKLSTCHRIYKKIVLPLLQSKLIQFNSIHLT